MNTVPDQHDVPVQRKTFVRLAKQLLRIAILVLIVYLLYHRLQKDWKIMEQALDALVWSWLAVGFVFALGYFLFRMAAWRRVMSGLGVTPTWMSTARSWINSEIVRYIPGNVWSFIGRIGYAQELQGSRTTVLTGIVVEMLALIFSATSLSALLLIPYPRFAFPVRLVACLIVAFGMYWLLGDSILRRILGLVKRLLGRRLPMLPEHAHAQRPFLLLLVGWISYAVFHLLTASALGWHGNVLQTFAVAGAVLLAWLVGYISFLTPSGLGVREAALVVLLLPFMPAAEGLLIAIVSRVILLAAEFIALIAVNALRVVRKTGVLPVPPVQS